MDVNDFPTLIFLVDISPKKGREACPIVSIAAIVCAHCVQFNTEDCIHD